MLCIIVNVINAQEGEFIKKSLGINQENKVLCLLTTLRPSLRVNTDIGYSLDLYFGFQRDKFSY